MATLRGADLVARALARGGTQRLFSLSGNQVMVVYDAAIDAGSTSCIRATRAPRCTWPTPGGG